MIDIIFDNHFQIIPLPRNSPMDCKKGYIHNFAWFEIQSKNICINCGMIKE